YVEAGNKFFVAKVDPKKVKMVDGHAALSPLRFHYDSDDFSLPIRLGMANSSGKQDLIVNVISADKRFEVANYKNVFIPTNFVLTRMHARYGKNDIKDDLRFKEAKPVTGGREVWTKEGLEYGAVPSEQNFFQARFAVRHWWTGAIKCKNPQRGVWGGPPDGN